MKIGIIGLGVVGAACKKGFEILEHEVSVYDIKLTLPLSSLQDCHIIFICVPTPENKDGSCDISNILHTIKELENLNYSGIVAIKSTTMPGTTQKLINESQLKICFVPEFLRERCAFEDFTYNHNLLVVGTNNIDIFKSVVSCHGALPKKIVMLSPTEAEILKYYSNVFNSLRIVFANVMYEICDKLDADYTKIKDTYLLRETASPHYLDVNSNLRGYGGMCLPKDTKALDTLVKELGINVKLFETLDQDNQQFITTVFPGMRA